MRSWGITRSALGLDVMIIQHCGDLAMVIYSVQENSTSSMSAGKRTMASSRLRAVMTLLSSVVRLNGGDRAG